MGTNRHLNRGTNVLFLILLQWLNAFWKSRRVRLTIMYVVHKLENNNNYFSWIWTPKELVNVTRWLIVLWILNQKKKKLYFGSLNKSASELDSSWSYWKDLYVYIYFVQLLGTNIKSSNEHSSCHFHELDYLWVRIPGTRRLLICTGHISFSFFIFVLELSKKKKKKKTSSS